MSRTLKVAMWVVGGIIALVFLFAFSEILNPTCTVMDYRGDGERMTTLCRNSDGRPVREQWVKVPTGNHCPGIASDVAYCDNGAVRVESYGGNSTKKEHLKTVCGDEAKYWQERSAADIAAEIAANGATSVSTVVTVDPAPDAPAFVKEMDKRWGESGRDGRYAAWERRMAWGTATVAGKKSVWYAWSNTYAEVTTWFNVVIPKSGMKVCPTPLGTYEGEAGYDCSYSRPLNNGEEDRTYAHDPKGMKWTSVFNSIHFGSGRWWPDDEANTADWNGDGKLTAAALVAQIQRDFPAVKQGAFLSGWLLPKSAFLLKCL